jgi:hypothetical protein
MVPLPVHEDRKSIVVELLGQVQRAHQILLSADNECVERAKRHYRHVLGVFSGLILNEGISDASKAARYLSLRRSLQQYTTAGIQ